MGVANGGREGSEEEIIVAFTACRDSVFGSDGGTGRGGGVGARGD